jgi:hypothetical protein
MLNTGGSYQVDETIKVTFRALGSFGSVDAAVINAQQSLLLGLTGSKADQLRKLRE